MNDHPQAISEKMPPPTKPAFVVDEPDDLKLKRFEELYRLTKEQCAAERERFEGVGINVARLIPLLGLVVALGTVGADRFLRVFQGLHSPLHWICACAYVCFWGAVAAAVTAFIAALSVRRIPVVRSGADMMRHFADNRYVDVLVSLAKRYDEAREGIEQQTDKKIKWMSTGWWFLLAAVLLGGVSIGTYVCLVP